MIQPASALASPVPENAGWCRTFFVLSGFLIAGILLHGEPSAEFVVGICVWRALGWFRFIAWSKRLSRLLLGRFAMPGLINANLGSWKSSAGASRPISVARRRGAVLRDLAIRHAGMLL